MLLRRALPVVLALLAAGSGAAQGVREHTRPRPRGTTVTQSQAEALTLTVSPVARRSIQTWIRSAGAIDRGGRTLTASLSGPEASLVQVDQRVRAFPPSSKSSMYQARVSRVLPRGGGRVDIEMSLVAPPKQDTNLYVVEIVVEREPLLSVPNEAIIEEGDRHVVYVQERDGQYVPHDITTGIQGELYTEVLAGVNEGDQVVTFGSFFIDAEQKLKGAVQQPATDGPAR